MRRILTKLGISFGILAVSSVGLTGCNGVTDPVTNCGFALEIAMDNNQLVGDVGQWILWDAYTTGAQNGHFIYDCRFFTFTNFPFGIGPGFAKVRVVDSDPIAGGNGSWGFSNPVYEGMSRGDMLGMAAMCQTHPVIPSPGVGCSETIWG